MGVDAWGRKYLGYIPYFSKQVREDVAQSMGQAKVSGVGFPRSWPHLCRESYLFVFGGFVCGSPKGETQVFHRRVVRIPRTVSRADRRPMAMVLDFSGFKRAQVASSFRLIASSMIEKSATEVTKIVTSSTQATIETGRADLPIWIPGRRNSSLLSRGCGHKAYRAILRGESWRTSQRIGFGPWE